MSNSIIFIIVIFIAVLIILFFPRKKKQSQGKERNKEETGRGGVDVNELQAQLNTKNAGNKIEINFFLEEEQTLPLSEVLGAVITGKDIEDFEEATLRALEEAQYSMPSEDEYEFFLQQDMVRELQDKSLDFSQLDAYIDEMQQKFLTAKTKNKKSAIASNQLEEDIFASSQAEALRIQEELNNEFKGLL